MALFARPHQFELWADLSLQNKHLRRNNWLHWGVHLALVLAFLLVAVRPLIAIRVDQLGRAELIENVSVANGPGPEEAEHVSRLLAQYLLEVTSGSVSRDLTKALALMTQDFQRAYREKVKDDPSLALVENGNVRSVLTFDPRATEVKAEKDASGRLTKYFVKLYGKVELFRADVLTAPLLARQVQVRTTLIAVPRTSQTLNGLLVDFFEKDYFEPPKSPSVNVSALSPTAAPAGKR